MNGGGLMPGDWKKMQPLASVDPEGAHLTRCLCNARMDLKLGLHQTPLLSLNNKWRGTDA